MKDFSIKGKVALFLLGLVVFYFFGALVQSDFDSSATSGALITLMFACCLIYPDAKCISRKQAIDTENNTTVCDISLPIEGEQEMIEEDASMSEEPIRKMSLKPNSEENSFVPLWDTWGNIHKDIEQTKRINRALDGDVKCDSIDLQSGIGAFIGKKRERYTTTLKKCSCVDFQRNKKPCKHIYYLAHELSVFNLAEDEDVFVQLTKTLKLLPHESIMLLSKMVKEFSFHDVKYFAVPKDEFSDLLLFKGYCIGSIATETILEALPVATIKQILQATNLNQMPPMNSQKKTFIKWFNGNQEEIANAIDEVYYIFEFIEQIENSSRELHGSIQILLAKTKTINKGEIR